MLGSFVLAGAVFACNSAPAKSGPGPREPIVAPETREASKELYGTQETFMQGMNQTDSEQAGARAEQDRIRRTPEREQGSK